MTDYRNPVEAIVEHLIEHEGFKPPKGLELGDDDKVKAPRIKSIMRLDVEVLIRGGALSRADLGSANLRGAYLRGAYLRSANLNGANLGSANLRGAILPDGFDAEGATK